MSKINGALHGCSKDHDGGTSVECHHDHLFKHAWYKSSTENDWILHAPWTSKIYLFCKCYWLASLKIETLITALSPNVVKLIKDINGNHVIQKCLNKLSFQDKQFIYDAVSKSCVQVATHRHGCCVLQRCIDFSADNQKVSNTIHQSACCSYSRLRIETIGQWNYPECLGSRTRSLWKLCGSICFGIRRCKILWPIDPPVHWTHG